MLERDKIEEISFEILHDNNLLHPIIVDGLDGSGKATIVNELSNLLSEKGNVLMIDLPQYNQPWGQIIKKVLHEDVIDLSLEERMILYVLNRLETINGIKVQSSDIYQRSQVPIFLLFDRFVTSNVLTCAYYSEKHGVDLDMEKLYKFMIDADNYFLSALHLENFHVVVPQIPPNLAIDAISKDTTRDAPDLYEKIGVQSIADEYYRKLGSFNNGNVTLLSQIKDGKRLSSAVVAGNILDMLLVKDEDFSSCSGIREKLNVINPDIESLGKIESILSKYPNLKRLDPY